MEYTDKGLSILEAARKLFAEKGYKAVTTKQIAQEAAANEVTIFRLFENKNKLFEEVIKYITNKPNISDYIDSEEPNFLDYLKGVGNLIHDVFVENLDVFKIEITERNMTSDKSKIAVFPNTIKNKFVEYIIKKKGVSKSEAEYYAICFIASVHGCCMNIYFLKTFHPSPEFEKCLQFIVTRFK
jgi:hypothetical protein